MIYSTLLFLALLLFTPTTELTRVEVEPTVTLEVTESVIDPEPSAPSVPTVQTFQTTEVIEPIEEPEEPIEVNPRIEWLQKRITFHQYQVDTGCSEKHGTYDEDENQIEPGIFLDNYAMYNSCIVTNTRRIQEYNQELESLS